MRTDQAVRTRRTHKAYGPDRVPRQTVHELVELATWAPNHRLTNPWRFRLIGPVALERLKRAAGPVDAVKLDRAPTLLAVTCLPGQDPEAAQEDRDAVAVAAYIVLLGAHARGLAGYWRTPGVLATGEGRAALALAPEEQVVGLLYLGHPRQEVRTPERAPVEAVLTELD